MKVSSKSQPQSERSSGGNAGAEIKARISQLQPESERRWGKMNAAQALARCTLSLKLAQGGIALHRTVLGWTIGPLLKKVILNGFRG